MWSFEKKCLKFYKKARTRVLKNTSGAAFKTSILGVQHRRKIVGATKTGMVGLGNGLDSFSGKKTSKCNTKVRPGFKELLSQYKKKVATRSRIIVQTRWNWSHIETLFGWVVLLKNLLWAIGYEKATMENLTKGDLKHGEQPCHQSQVIMLLHLILFRDWLLYGLGYVLATTHLGIILVYASVAIFYSIFYCILKI